MKKITPEVSIVVPVFNVENYIERCVKSIISQTLKTIEIIFLDDGSTDNSLNILRDYEKKDERRKVSFIYTCAYGSRSRSFRCMCCRFKR